MILRITIHDATVLEKLGVSLSETRGVGGGAKEKRGRREKKGGGGGGEKGGERS